MLRERLGPRCAPRSTDPGGQGWHGGMGGLPWCPEIPPTHLLPECLLPKEKTRISLATGGRGDTGACSLGHLSCYRKPNLHLSRGWQRGFISANPSPLPSEGGLARGVISGQNLILEREPLFLLGPPALSALRWTVLGDRHVVSDAPGPNDERFEPLGQTQGCG